MKTVLIVGEFSTESFGLHIAETLSEMGHKVLKFIPGYNAPQGGNLLLHRMNQVRRVIHHATNEIPRIRARRMKVLWSLAKEQSIDYVIVCHDFLQPKEVQNLKELTNAKICLWFPDALVNFGKGYFMNAAYDGLFFKDPFIVKALMSVPLSPVYYMPECFNPKRHKLDADSISEEYKCEITTAGNAHSWRVAFYQHLKNYHVKIWGPTAPLWMPIATTKQMFQNKMVFNGDKAQAFLGAKIVLNNLHYGEIWGLNVRTFEAAGIGAFQMVDWRPGLEQLFKDGEEIISFKNLDELHSKIEYWLSHPSERQKIAHAGKARALHEHTYELRLKLIFATLEQQAHGFPLPII
ncbi:MAG: glycosyltransferase [Burkholderiales bacterium]|nr:glycosyltransferase [Burkholderiales bacterium]